MTDETTVEAWVLATDTTRIGAMVDAARGLGGRVTVAALGQRALAEAAAAAGPDAVRWIEPAEGVPAEGYGAGLARAVAAASPRLVVAATTPAGRALLGAAAIALDAVVVAGLLTAALEGDTVVAERLDLDGRLHETVAVRGSVAGLFGGDDRPATPAAEAPIERLDPGSPADIRIERLEPIAGANAGVTSAERVVSVGRGLKAKADLELVEGLAAALGAEIGCSMPIADDYGWVAKERYIGRSGQHIAPRLYLAIGISGTPQHMEGVREARTIVAINADPDAHIFGRADYGIVGDLYEVIPALREALGK